jgi:phosphoribosylformylglycinamidine synthase
MDETILEGDERVLLVSLFQREPTRLEEVITQGLWNEHCSYKSSRVWLEQFRELGTKLGGIEENAGGIRLSDGTVVVFKMESHNHPSFIEPFQGAATGVGGILRDIFAMGARPIALLNGLFFGEAAFGRTPYLVSRVIEGIGWYGNCVGVPTVGGMFLSDEGYNTNCLVNVMAVGVIEPGREIMSAKAKGIGNLIVYAGQKTGPDGIYGSSMASKSFGDGLEHLRPQVQVGDPLKGKLLIEVTLKLIEKGLVVACQDMGASGLVSSVFEMASKGRLGVRFNLDAIPLRLKGMQPWEILLSESQERMVYVLRPEDAKEALDILKKYELDAAIIGEIVESEEIEVIFGGSTILRFPHLSVINASPRLKRPMAFPLKPRSSQPPPDQISLKELRYFLDRMMAHPNQGSKEEIYTQFDFEVGICTLIPPSLGPCVIRVYPGKETAIAIAIDSQPFLAESDPKLAAHRLLGELTLSLACLGAKALGITNCLNFGTPEDPKVMHALKETIDGLAEACKRLEISVVSGNVSLYNATQGKSIPPTAVVGMIGEVQSDIDPALQRPLEFGDGLWLIECAKPSLEGSRFQRLLAPEWGDKEIPSMDYERFKRLLELVLDLKRESFRVIGPKAGGILVALVRTLLTQACQTSPQSLAFLGLELNSGFFLDPVYCFGEGGGKVIVGI